MSGAATSWPSLMVVMTSLLAKDPRVGRSRNRRSLHDSEPTCVRCYASVAPSQEVIQVLDTSGRRRDSRPLELHQRVNSGAVIQGEGEVVHMPSLVLLMLLKAAHSLPGDRFHLKRSGGKLKYLF